MIFIIHHRRSARSQLLHPRLRKNATKALLIDPGDDTDTILQLIEDHNIKVVEIIATHGHFDHIGRVASLKRKNRRTIRHPQSRRIHGRGTYRHCRTAGALKPIHRPKSTASSMNATPLPLAAKP